MGGNLMRIHTSELLKKTEHRKLKLEESHGTAY
jgi:hypothetical protein